MERRHRLVFVLVALALLGAALACGPLGGGQTYRSRDGGFVIRYPAGWEYAESSGEVAFLPHMRSGGPISPNDSVIVAVEAGALDTLAGGKMARALNARDMLAAFLKDVLVRDAEAIGDVGDIEVGNRKAAFADLVETFDGTATISGRVVCVYLGERGVVIVGMGSMPGAWEGFVPNFEAMLKSISFFDP